MMINASIPRGCFVPVFNNKKTIGSLMRALITKIKKLLSIVIVGDKQWIRALWIGAAAGAEHTVVLQRLDCKTIVDVGANRGQFALAARHSFPSATIFSFEPLDEPAAKFRRVFSSDSKVILHDTAIGPKKANCVMHVSGRDDSSSLLPISSLQEEIFPGTSEAKTTDVRVAPLDDSLCREDIVGPAMLKLDVQGFELEALQGCESLLSLFDWVYCECSFVELYSGQKLAFDVINWLANRGFLIAGMYNPSYDRDGKAVQSDFLFKLKRSDLDGDSPVGDISLT
jgi:FkbM family methyltransferase